MRRLGWSAFFTLSLLIAVHSASIDVFCQQTVSGATLSGIVRDANNSILPGAKVSAINLETSHSQSSIADGSGYFRIQFLPVVEYQIKAEQTGFASGLRRITLMVGQSMFVEFKLNVQGVSAGVDVQSDGALVETTRTQVAETVTP